MANLITFSRFLLLFLLMASTYHAAPAWQLANAPLVLLIIALDGLDGYVARVRRESSVFGAVFDIAVDRVVETVLWVMFGHLGLVPIWVAFVFIIRGALVDSIRYAAVSEGQTPFGMMQTPLGRFIVAGRFMRGLYGTVKAVTFAWVLLLQPLPQLAPALWARWAAPAALVADVLVYVSVTLCLVRGLPVVAEFLARQALSLPGGEALK